MHWYFERWSAVSLEITAEGCVLTTLECAHQRDSGFADVNTRQRFASPAEAQAAGQARAAAALADGWTELHVTRETVQRGGVALRTTRDARGDIVEICQLDAQGRPGLPSLTLSPERRGGTFLTRAMADSYSDGEALAGTAYSDEPHAAKMTYEAWRDAYLEWFQKYL
jgi:hypothetical protein